MLSAFSNQLRDYYSIFQERWSLPVSFHDISQICASVFNLLVQESVKVRNCIFIVNRVNFTMNIFGILAFNTEKARSSSNLRFGAWIQLTHNYEPFTEHVRVNNTNNYSSYPKSHNVFFILAERIWSPYDFSPTSAKCNLLSDSPCISCRSIRLSPARTPWSTTCFDIRH